MFKKLTHWHVFTLITNWKIQFGSCSLSSIVFVHRYFYFSKAIGLYTGGLLVRLLNKNSTNYTLELTKNSQKLTDLANQLFLQLTNHNILLNLI